MANKDIHITSRQAKILAALVKEFCDNPQPISSDEIANKYHFDFSSATIRSEMAALEKLGYLEQPHTSSGRVPTDKGYRYFVNELMKRFELSLREQKALKDHLLLLQKQNQEIGRNIAKLLSEKTDQAAFAIMPEESSGAGLSRILQQSNADKKELVEVVQFFENIEEYSDQLAQYLKDQPGALIGKEHHVPQISNYSLIVSQVKLPSGKKGIIGIIGPRSMRYAKNMTLVEYVAKFLSSGLLLILLTAHK